MQPDVSEIVIFVTRLIKTGPAFLFEEFVVLQGKLV